MNEKASLANELRSITGTGIIAAAMWPYRVLRRSLDANEENLFLIWVYLKQIVAKKLVMEIATDILSSSSNFHFQNSQKERTKIQRKLHSDSYSITVAPRLRSCQQHTQNRSGTVIF